MHNKEIIETNDTIVAEASPAGRGGVSIIRLSGLKSLKIAAQLIQTKEESIIPRRAMFVNCYSQEKQCLDEAILIYFPKPSSFTGEEVVEIQCHGSPVVVDLIISQLISYGAKTARPGEFSQRAFLNNKIDLTQAEAIADLIDSQSKQAAKNALESLKGKFSREIQNLTQQIIDIRCFVEAAIDFPDEEGVEFLHNEQISKKLEAINNQLKTTTAVAKQGLIYQTGVKVVIAGEPNAGKSSLLNALCQKEIAIVTHIAGTTRDTLRENISINGIPVNLVDTAGLRESADLVEQEGIKRAWNEIKTADIVLYVYDGFSASNPFDQLAWQELMELNEHNSFQKMLLLENKIDLSYKQPERKIKTYKKQSLDTVLFSAKNEQGIDLLKKVVFEKLQISSNAETGFSARKRHINALENSAVFISAAIDQSELGSAFELMAEDMRMAQQALEEITGVYTPDDLLGHIFSTFCIGK